RLARRGGTVDDGDRGLAGYHRRQRHDARAPCPALPPQTAGRIHVDDGGGRRSAPVCLRGSDARPMSEPIIQVEHLSLAPILEGVSFSVERGRALTLVGPS